MMYIFPRLSHRVRQFAWVNRTGVLETSIAYTVLRWKLLFILRRMLGTRDLLDTEPSSLAPKRTPIP